MPNYSHDRHLGLNQLVRSAAYAMNCPIAVFYQEIEGILQPVACFGAPPPPSYNPGERFWDTLSTGSELPLVINDMAVEQRGPILDALLIPEPDTADARAMRFMALMPVFGDQYASRGLLLVADPDAHAGLSAAQTHVLHTHAVQLNLGVACHSARQNSDLANKAASERLRLLESVVVNANDAILITEAEPVDLPGPRIVYCNDAFTRTTGYSESDILGKTPRILQGDETSRSALDRLRQALKNWRAVEVELLNNRKDGTRFWVELSIVPVADERGWFTHWISVQRDVSERKQAEEIATQARLAQAEKAVIEDKLREREQAQEMLTYAAFHDDLTKLYNRAYIMERLRDALNSRGAAKMALLFLDMDRFKLVNDSLGHRAGDLLLMEMSRRLEECVRIGDTLSRVGGDEFVVLMQDVREINTAIALAERILEKLRVPFKLADQSIYVSASIGIVEMDDQYTHPDAPLRDADIAMYAAKANGADQYSVFTNSMRAQSVATLALQNDLKHAINGHEFLLEYQPIYNPTNRMITGVEALIRWRHPTRGLVPPSEFIPMAENIAVIRDIGRWVMYAACQQMSVWMAQYPDLALNLNVNVSGHELVHESFLNDLKSTLAQSGFPPQRMQIEVTENVFLNEPNLVANVLESVRALGLKVALDDFGTGYSSLSYIDWYPIDTIKIDRSFICRMLTGNRPLSIVDCILRLGKTLKLEIVAEGVETDAQLAKLKSMDCPLIQGYLFDRPMSPERLEARLRSHVIGQVPTE